MPVDRSSAWCYNSNLSEFTDFYHLKMIFKIEGYVIEQSSFNTIHEGICFYFCGSLSYEVVFE